MKLSASLLFFCSLLLGLFLVVGIRSTLASEAKLHHRPSIHANGSSYGSLAQAECPSVTNYFPRIGYAGYGVTLIGHNLTGVSAVRFANNRPGSFEIINNMEIRVIIPLGAVSGPITISKTGCPDILTDTFTIPPSPVITLSPATQVVGVGGNTTILVNFNLALITPVAVTLTSSNPAVVSVPPFFTIPPGAISASFEVTGVSAGSATTITATLPENLGGSSATTTVSTTTRVVSLNSVRGLVGTNVRLPIDIVSQNEENQIIFSISFDPALLVNPQVSIGADIPSASVSTINNQVSQGLLGVKIELPPGEVITSGTRQIGILEFEVPATALAGPTTVRFVDQPLERRVLAGTSVPLQFFFKSGLVVIDRGLEADSAPRPSGDGVLGATDWVQVGRFVSGTDSLPGGTEFQRADCAPRTTFGDGILSVTDWVQAGRYINKLDAMSAAGGPSSPSATSFAAPSEIPGLPNRSLRLVEDFATMELAVELNAMGDENAIGFSLQFDAKRFRFLSIRKDLLPANATLIINDSDATQGRLGVLLALEPGKKMPGGLQSILKIAFVPVFSVTTTESLVRFTDFPVLRQVSDAGANALPARFENLLQPAVPFSPIAFAAAYRPSAVSGN